MDKLTKCMCCGGGSLHKGGFEKNRSLWIAEKAKFFRTKHKYSLVSTVCADCGYAHWFATGDFHELKER